ncbi:hypothetical protein BDR26DRAFT_853720 [Obelidium mucronatum]|nr:hypothetical protein BDR26DRAFT_853720 [Obelidium mucronatum]
MTKSEQIIISSSVEALEFKATNSWLPVDVTVLRSEDQKDVQISYEFPQNAGEDTAVDAQVSPKGTLAIHVTASKKGGILNFLNPVKKFTDRIKMTIMLPPRDVVFVSTVGNGDFNWEGPNITSSFKAVLDMGCVKLTSPINVDSLDVTLKMGSFNATDAVVHQTVVCRAEMGEVKGKFSGYKSLNLHTSMGALKCDLAPGLDSNSLISTDMGEVVANVVGFEGKFCAQAEMGSVQVTAPGVVQKSNPCSGVVGPNESPVSSLNVKVSIGGCKVNFLS